MHQGAIVADDGLNGYRPIAQRTGHLTRVSCLPFWGSKYAHKDGTRVYTHIGA